MALLKKIFLALFVTTLMFGTAQSVMAAEKGAPTLTLKDVIALNEQTIAAMKNNESAEKVAALMKETKQASKSVVISGPADLNKQRGSDRIKKSRRSYRDGKVEEAIKLAEDALVFYKKSQKVAFIK